MMLGSYYFKEKAREALKGNWQTAMVVTFFSGIFMTIAEVIQTVYFPDLYAYTDPTQLMLAISKVPEAAWIALLAVNLLALLATPMLSLGCCHYFVKRLQHEELGAAGLLSRANRFLRALWLYLYMGIRIMLWGLLLVVPGIIAAIRYSMAPYYMAENPDMTAGEAIEASKNAMKELKMSYFALYVSFIGWMLAANVIQILLLSISGVVGTVAGLFMQVAINAYMNAAMASFFLTVSTEGGVQKVTGDMQQRMREMGVDPEAMMKKPDEEQPKEQDDGTDESKPSDGGEEP